MKEFCVDICRVRLIAQVNAINSRQYNGEGNAEFYRWSQRPLEREISESFVAASMQAFATPAQRECNFGATPNCGSLETLREGTPCSFAEYLSHFGVSNVQNRLCNDLAEPLQAA